MWAYNIFKVLEDIFNIRRVFFGGGLSNLQSLTYLQFYWQFIHHCISFIGELLSKTIWTCILQNKTWRTSTCLSPCFLRRLYVYWPRSSLKESLWKKISLWGFAYRDTFPHPQTLSFQGMVKVFPSVGKAEEHVTTSGRYPGMDRKPPTWRPSRGVPPAMSPISLENCLQSAEIPGSTSRYMGYIEYEN